MRAEFSEIISGEAEKIDLLLKTLPELEKTEESPWTEVLEAEEYALSAGGKRIRPVLAVEFYKLFSKKHEAEDFVYRAALALELTHTFSLIHDDMPEMDDDDMRRGKPSTHIKYGAALGLLAGDGLAILPFEILSDLAEKGCVSFETSIKLIKTLSACSGNRGMIAGQVLDLWSEQRAADIDGDFLRKMSELKTGRMLKASCLFGAILADASENELKSAELYAENIGLAFQIVDDVLDVISDAATLGKPIGSDSERMKPTFADVFGIGGAMLEARRLSKAAADEISKYPGGELLSEFALSLAERKN